MRDYSLTLDESKMFILNYTIQNNNIIMNLATCKKHIIPYSMENEKKVLEKMRYQIENANEFLKDASDRALKNKRWQIIDVLVVIIILFFSMIEVIINFKIAIGFIVIFTSLAVFRTYFDIYIKKTLVDLEKNKFFIENEAKINEKVKHNNYNISKIVAKKKN